jgi:hypothetical protein
MVIAQGRLTLLKFMVANNGLTPAGLESLMKQGKKLDKDLGSMVAITLGELKIFLELYEASRTPEVSNDNDAK